MPQPPVSPPAWIDLLLPWVIVVAQLWALRRLERWQHQHIFKVGWLVTQKLSTTTLIYYLFFLPGVLLHEFTVFITASLLNVRAERAIALPEAQSNAELRLNFIKLPRNLKPTRAAVIALAPFAVGVFVLWVVSTSILRVDVPLNILSERGLSGMGDAFAAFTRTPDVWLWAYILFTIGNTMIPSGTSYTAIKTFRTPLLFGAGVIGVLYILGIGSTLISATIAQPLTRVANVLETALAFVLVLDIAMVALLGTIESVIERFSGRSATYIKGKFVTYSPEEIAAQRAQRQAKKEQAQVRAAKQAEQAATVRARTGGAAPSIYAFPLPTPPAPPREGIEQFLGEAETSASP